MAVELIRDFTGRGETSTQALRGGLGLKSPAAEGPPPPGFGELLKDFGNDVNQLQFKASNSIDMLVTGQSTDVHQVMVAVEEAGIALDLMLEIRNRVLEGYQELIRMQV